jgi:aminopeptidase N
MLFSVLTARTRIRANRRFWCMGWFLLIVTLCGCSAQSPEQPAVFTRQDSLRGSLRPERTGYDVVFYDLNLQIDPTTRSLSGRNTIRYRVVAPFRRMQLDLFANMQITSIVPKIPGPRPKPLSFVREGNAVFVTMPARQQTGQVYELTVNYGGKPQEAVNPPWDGGFVWKQSPTGKPWVTVACEGKGASLWWPCKDHLSDEPDSMQITCRVPTGLTCVSNGTLRRSRPVGAGQTEFVYAVQYPINSYNVTLNITDYERLTDTYRAADGDTLPLTYFVLPGNAAKARTHFEQVKPMLACYEQYLGKFPFWRDGYKLVETPYWGMEHQTAIAYGNRFRNNNFDFDYIIVHESGHEYFGNSLSCPDHAEMWIHESFTTYLEMLYVECRQGPERAMTYLNSQRGNIENKRPMLGPSGVNADQKDNDIYYKGSWMLHSLRRAVDNDSLWFRALKALAMQKQRSIVTTAEVIEFLSRQTGRNLRPLMTEYLTVPQLPTLEYEITPGSTPDDRPALRYRWLAQTPGFDLPVRVRLATGPDAGRNTWQRLQPTREWQQTTLAPGSGPLVVDLDGGLFEVKGE